MKILIVSQYFWPENFRINDLTAGLVARGHEVTVLTGIPNYPGGRFFPGYGLFRNLRQHYHGARVLRVPLIPRGKGGGIRLALNYLSFALSASVLAPFLCSGRFDLIFVCQLSPVTVALPALLLKKLKNAPVILWVLDLWPESLAATGAVRSEKILGMVKQLVRFIYSECDMITAASRGFITSISDNGVSVERMGYFPNWCEPEYQAKPGDSRETEHSEMPEGFRIMFAGNIGAAQDFETILAVAEMLKGYPDIHWVVLGDGRKFAWVKEQVNIRGLANTVHLFGRHPPERMTGFFSRADVMLVTLKNDPAFAITVPGKIQSYMACGRPILAALNGEGARLIMESGAGLASPAEDTDALRKIVLSMYRMSREEREAMGKQGREYCEANFDREMLISRLEEWMRELI